MFKVIIAGGRDFDDWHLLCKTCHNLLKDKDYNQVEIVEGGAKGADRLGFEFYRANGTKHKRFPADWHTHGKKAGILRNIEMAEYADALIAFWDGKSRGTKHMIEVAKEKGLLIRVIKY